MKKKIIFLIFLFLFFSGCNNNNNFENVETIIEENNSIIIGINYPTTGYKKLDNKINYDIDKIYNDFKNKYDHFYDLPNKIELNIDYIYNLLDENIITICLNIYINDNINKINYVLTYNFNIKKNSFIAINDIIDNNIKKIDEYIYNQIGNYFYKINNKDYLKNFSFDDKNLYLYINIDNDIFDIVVPLNELKLNFKKKDKEKLYAIKTSKYIDVDKKIVALTFDDGPTKYTNQILDILKKEEAVATFFIVGNKTEIYRDTLIKSIQYGNEIGNHSFNHKWLTRVTNNELKEQIDKTQKIIRENIDYTPTLFRPTYGSINTSMKKNIDLDIVLWDVDTMDWKYKNINTIVNRATSNIKDMDIILMHDTKIRTVEALKKIIPILKKKGFTFVTVSDLKKIKSLRENE